MSKNFEAKKVVVSEIEEKIEKAESIVIVEYKALTVDAVTALRAKCRAANVDYCVLKNTLVKRALENKGIKIDERRSSRDRTLSSSATAIRCPLRSLSRSSSPPLRRTRDSPR